MNFIFKNTQKVRGWRRRIKALDAWQKRCETPDFDRFENRKEDYIKLYIHPWYALQKRQPPAKFQREILKRMLQLMHTWNEHFKAHNQPFDLQMWLFQPNFISSEIVCAKVENWGEKRDNYFKLETENKPFPHLHFQNKDLENLTWDLRFFENVLQKKEDNLDDIFIQSLLKEGYKSEIILQGSDTEDVMYSKKDSDVWIGRFR